MGHAQLIGPASNAAPQLLPLAASAVQAGVPSPAEDFAAKRIDLNDELIVHPQATFWPSVGCFPPGAYEPVQRPRLDSRLQLVCS